MNQQKEQLTINIVTRTSDWRIFAKRKFAVKGQMSVVKCPQEGFTLVELLVTLGIFAVITGAVLANYRGYNTNALFANASEDIVLALRQAQVYGVGVKGTGTSFTTPYGVYFETTNPNQIKIFADADSNGIYSAGDNDIEIIKWPSTIGIATSNGLLCDSTSVVTNLSVTFTRPNPDATIYTATGPCATDGKIAITNGIKNALVTITSTGQISLQ